MHSHVSAHSSFFGSRSPKSHRASRAAMADQDSPTPMADWSISRSPSRSKSRPRSPEPAWMEQTAKRLEAGASAAEKAAAAGGRDMKAMYVMSSAAIIQSASSQPQPTSISETKAYQEVSSSQPRSHVEASYVLNRLTGGGYKKPEMKSGPFATALNPNRHAMMIQGRPVVVPCVRKHTHTYEFSATFLRPAFQEMVLNRFSHSARPGVEKIMGHSEAQSNAEQRREDQSNSEWQDTWNSTVCPVIMTFCFFHW